MGARGVHGGCTSSLPSLSLRGTTKRKSGRAPPRTPEPVDGRKHIDIQTDAYLEELTDTVPEVDNNTQTDAFLDRPPTPLFVPQKSGLDATTQIENGVCAAGCHAHVATRGGGAGAGIMRMWARGGGVMRRWAGGVHVL